MNPIIKIFLAFCCVVSPIAGALILIPRSVFKTAFVAMIPPAWGPALIIWGSISIAIFLGCVLARVLLFRK